jgi:hypothetical protein
LRASIKAESLSKASAPGPADRLSVSSRSSMIDLIVHDACSEVVAMTALAISGRM